MKKNRLPHLHQTLSQIPPHSLVIPQKGHWTTNQCLRTMILMKTIVVKKTFYKKSVPSNSRNASMWREHVWRWERTSTICKFYNQTFFKTIKTEIKFYLQWIICTFGHRQFLRCIKACSDEKHGNSCVCKYLSTTTEDPLPIPTANKFECKQCK